MTDPEIMFILQELHGAGLANEPKDPQATLSIWRDFFGGDDVRVIGKTVWLHLRKSKFWPTPSDLLKNKQRAQWLIEMEDEDKKKLNALGGETHTYPQSMNQSTQPPRAPAINIAEKAQDFCQLCGLCEIKDQSKCPYDY